MTYFFRSLTLFVILNTTVTLAETVNNALPVELIQISRTPVISNEVITGTIEADQSYAVSFETGGRLIDVMVEAGDTIEAGEMIASMDSTQQRAAERGARAGLEGAKAAFVQAREDYDRQSSLLKKGFATQPIVEQAEQKLVSARSAREQSEAKLASAKTALENTKLIVSSDSLVVSRKVEPGQIVGAGQPIVELASSIERNAVFLVPDGIPAESFLGRKVDIHFLDRNIPDMEAVVSEVSPVIDEKTGSIRVKARILERNSSEAKLGEVVQGQVQVTSPDAFILPWYTLTSTADGPAVWTVKPDTMMVELKFVKIKQYTTDSVIIADGLIEGMSVVGEGSQLLYPGRIVRDRTEEGVQ